MEFADRRGRPLAMLRLLLAAVIVIPVLALATGGYFLRQTILTEAMHDLRQRTDLAVENVERVFETHALMLAEMDRLTRGQSDAELRAQETELHSLLAEMMRGIPQIWDLAIWGIDGRMLVSGRLFPVPEVVASADYFAPVRDGAPEPFISKMMTGRMTNGRFFNVVRRRSGASPGFHGELSVAIEPRYFERRWVETGLASPGGDNSMGLLRPDGTIIVRAPSAELPQGSASPAFMAALNLADPGRPLNHASRIDGIVRYFVFERVSKVPLIVSGAITEAAVQAAFISAITPHLWFGVPATVMLVWLVSLVLLRTRQAETDRAARAEAERTLTQTARLDAIGRLAAGIAHDFNNILAAVTGSQELLLRRLRNQRQDGLEMIAEQGLQAARRGAALTRQILTFARGADAPEEALQVDTIISQVTAFLPPLIGPSIRLDTDIGGGLWTVRAVRPLLEAALVNLAANARDVMPDGGTLTISAANMPRGSAVLPPGLRGAGDWVRIAVRDTGPGFPADARAHAFEPFFTTKDVGRGTGLGLAQVYAAASQAGGVARIEDQPGGGGVVALYLPRGGVAEVAMLARAPTPDARRLRVLLVDDDRMVQAVSAMALRDAGHAVVEADSGAAGLDMLRGDPAIEVLVVDYAMPGMTGAEMIQQARRLRPDLPVVMVSGQGSFDSIYLPADVQRLAKPFLPDDLMQMVAAVTAGRQTEAVSD